MGMVETQSMTQSEVSSPLGESTKVEGLEKGKVELKEVLSSVGDQGLCGDGFVQVVESRVLETKVSVSVMRENDSEVMVDSEKINGGSSLLEMQESCKKLDCEGKVAEAAVLSGDGLMEVDVKESEEEKKDENSDGKVVNLEVPIMDTSEEGKKDENCDGKIVTLDVPIAETSAEGKKDENCDGKIVNLKVPIAETIEEEEKKDGKCDGKIVTLDVPIVDTSEEEKNDENCDGKFVTLEVPIVVDTSEEMNVKVEDMNDERYGFSVGDFVWGKIKSHPWWPGRVYDSSDASDFALKLKQKNRLLVAYFGDGTFAWCHPSQLKPFEDNFDDMVRQSSSKAFNNAVQEAVNEVGKLLDMKMSRSFVAGETTFVFDLPLAKNAGIKEGIRVPESGIEKLSALAIEPAELLSQVKQIAETIDIASILELEILKVRLSAFYLSRGGYRLAYYENPQTVVGLEDSSPDEAVDEGNGKSVVEAPVKGPFEEDYSTKAGGPLSGSRSNRSRKQKSIAEIMGEDEDVVHTKNKKKDATDEVVDAIGSNGREERKGGEDAVASKSVRKRKELCLNTDNEDEGQGDKENSEKGTDEEKSIEQHEKDSLRRERKKSKYLSPPFTTSIRELVKGKIEKEAGDGGQLSPPALKRNGEASQDRELSNSSKRRIKHDEKKTIDPEALQVSSGEVLSEVRDAAISPQIPRESNSLDKFADFVLVLRSSLFLEGLLYKVYNERQFERKRKKPESDHGVLEKNEDQSNHISAGEDSEPTKKRRKAVTPRIPKEKKALETKTIKKGMNEKSSAALLFVSFGPGSSTLPTKSDLISIFSKFGALNEDETDMFRTNYTARVSFLRTRDAEKALNQSEKVNPFESANVTYELQYVSDDGSKSKSSQNKKKRKTPPTTKASVTPQQCTNEASKLNFIKHELEGLNSMLETSDGKSPDFKTKIESKVKSLLEDVNKMVESNST